MRRHSYFQVKTQSSDLFPINKNTFSSNCLFYTVTTGYAQRFHSQQAFSFEHYRKLCANEFFRYSKNPSATAYLLLQKDPTQKSRNAEVSQFDFRSVFNSKNKETCFPTHETKVSTESGFYITPSVQTLKKISAYENTQGDVILEGFSKNGSRYMGHPSCEINFYPKFGTSQHYIFYPMMPKLQTKNNPISIPRILNTPEGIQLHKEKSDYCKSKKALQITSADIIKRDKFAKRDPDQNTVMNQKAIEAYRLCANEYEKILNPALFHLLLHSANIIHLSTLRAMEKKGEDISKAEVKRHIEQRHLRPEWLHLYAFGLHSIGSNPQTQRNLGAARALDNTRMLLLERQIKWIALNIPNSKNELFGYFNMFLDSEVIDHIELNTSSKFDGAEVLTHQNIDPLLLDPSQIPASDMAGLIAVTSLLLQNCRPSKVENITIKPSPVITAPEFLDLPVNFFPSQGIANNNKSMVNNYFNLTVNTDPISTP